MADDDDGDEGFETLYENGHWVWDENIQGLAFKSDLPPKPVEVHMPIKVITGTIEFRDDIDLIEQLRFRKRYQRKLDPGQADVITLQDVKDVAIYTAPVSLLSVSLIKVLHLGTTERFLRSLILYCQYYLQVANIMENRLLELENKVRTPECNAVEIEYHDNLSDLRVLVAKEYGTILTGGADTKRFHHMGPEKKLKSLPDRDARLFESLLRISVQIVWLALGRKSFNHIELEINRLFKSEKFNSVEHILRTGYLTKMAKEEKDILLGRCLRHDSKLNSRSPIMNQVFCSRPIDYQMMGLGVIKYSELSPRLHYMQIAASEPEENMQPKQVTVGILGLPRLCFDTMLRVVSVDVTKSMGLVASSAIKQGNKSTNFGKRSKSIVESFKNIYPDINLPPPEPTTYSYPSLFPEETMKVPPCNALQRKRWLHRLERLRHMRV